MSDRIQEERHQGEPWLMYVIGNLTAISPDWIRSVGLAWLFKEGGKWVFTPRITGDTSLFYNAVFFVRLSLPAGIFASFRWSGSRTSKALLQGSLGIKLNGRLAIGVAWILIPILICLIEWQWWMLLTLPAWRIQSDASSAAGVTGPNLGQSGGFTFGTH